ncbi:hypothetical protein KCG47_18230 [Microvirga sp. SRT04]|uniref:Bacterial alpha-2-macroglobulin MG10 domain-containing protein n=1 Tax=Hymenobacter properus TaxID=2791026 RepID=A0A931BLI8_9BACT|nr:hypothetical protein [Hymenobacter properus]MBF9143587.1 hypothetical protein [Hymenobacter properus]MBR7722400.1 hypothetical protein [Microvirga sp. SRT04]
MASGQGREEDAYLKVRRQFLTRDGAPLGTPTFRQNDLVVVKLTLEASEAAGVIKNAAVTDLLPAGLEIEHPSIGALREQIGRRMRPSPITRMCATTGLICSPPLLARRSISTICAGRFRKERLSWGR